MVFSSQMRYQEEWAKSVLLFPIFNTNYIFEIVILFSITKMLLLISKVCFDSVIRICMIYFKVFKNPNRFTNSLEFHIYFILKSFILKIILLIFRFYNVLKKIFGFLLQFRFFSSLFQQKKRFHLFLFFFCIFLLPSRKSPNNNLWN